MIWIILLVVILILSISSLLELNNKDNRVLEIIFYTGMYMTVFLGIIGIIGIVTVNILSLSSQYSDTETLCKSGKIENFQTTSFIYNAEKDDDTEYYYYSMNGDYFKVKTTDAKIKYIDDSSAEYINIYGYKEIPNKIEEALYFWFYLKRENQEPSYVLSYCELYVHKDSVTQNNNINLE